MKHVFHTAIDTDSSTQPGRRNVGKACYGAENICWNSGRCLYCGDLSHGWCCMQGKFGGGCDGKVGGVDQFECTGEDPGGKMLKYIYAKNKRFINIQHCY